MWIKKTRIELISFLLGYVFFFRYAFILFLTVYYIVYTGFSPLFQRPGSVANMFIQISIIIIYS